jgi:hypothetical protein
VLSPTHAALTLALAGPRRRRRGLLALGAVLPDLPALAFGALDLARRRPGRAALAEGVYGGRRAVVHRAVHNVWAPAAVAAAGGPRARSLAAGWAGHLAVDLLTHHDDAWPLLWPASDAAWRSPVSYWQAEHHAGALRAAEVAGLLLALRGRQDRAKRVACAVALGAAALATADRLPRPDCSEGGQTTS